MQNKAFSFRASKRRHPLFLFIIAISITALFPSFLLANADKIFKENNKAVVVVVAYDQQGEPISQGSGFIVRPDGAIVTNYHVISNAKGIAVKAGNKIIEVEGFIYMDKENDLVILKAKAKNLPFVKIGDINKANIGEKVYVISSPEGLENTMAVIGSGGHRVKSSFVTFGHVKDVHRVRCSHIAQPQPIADMSCYKNHKRHP